MARTPNPSVSDLFAMRYLVNGDTGSAEREIILRLQEQLPTAIAQQNTLRGWVGAQAIDIPLSEDIMGAPADVTDAHIGKVLVACFVSKVNQGSGSFKSNINVAIQWVGQRIVNEHQTRVLWDKGELITLCLFPFLNGCVNDAELLCWRQLIPGAMRISPGDEMKNFSTVTCEFLVVQPPNMNTA